MLGLRISIVMAVACAASSAFAQCADPSPLASAAPAIRARPLETRYRALATQDRYRDVLKSIEQWRSLVADTRADAGASPEILPVALSRLAWALVYVGRVSEASIVGADAVKTLTAQGAEDAPYAAEVLAVVSMVQVDAGAIDDADRNAHHALAIIDRIAPESAAASIAHNGVANIAYSRARYGDAEREYARATELAIRCFSPDHAEIVNQMASHAGVLYMAGRSEEALVENERAANWALAHLDEASPVITLTLGNLGVMLRSAGRYAEAEAALRRVVDLEGKYQHDSWFYRAISLSNYASVIDRQGRHKEAEALWLQSSEWHVRAPVKRDAATRAYPLRFSADSAQGRGDLATALARREQAVKLMEPNAPADHPELARARIELARTLALSNRPQEALKVAEPAIAVVRAKLGQDDAKRLTAEIDYARVVAEAKDAETAYALIAPIAARLETKLLDSATARGDLLRYGPVFSSSFATVVDLALTTGRTEAAFHALQLANLSDIVLVNSEVAVRAAAGDGRGAVPIRTLQDRMRERQTLDRARTFAAAAGNSAEAARIEAAIQANDHAIEAAAHELDTVFPAYKALGRPVPLTLDAFRTLLAPDQILLAPLPTDSGTLAIMVTRDGLVWDRTAATRPDVTAWVERVRSSIDRARVKVGTPFDQAAARALYDALIPSALAANFKAHPSLLYYSSGALAALPPALLIAPDRSAGTAWLIRYHDVTVLPTLAVARAEPTVTRPIHFLGIGAPALAASATSAAGPIFGGSALTRTALAGLAPLPYAERELRRIGALIGSSSAILTGASASQSAVERAADQRYDVIAIATHALGGGSLAGLNEPALVLSPAGSDDGLLTASEVAGLRLDADWVILSGCDTASGIGDGSPAYSGLASAFMQAGAHALLVSHWPVRDDAAEALTVATVRNARRGLSRPRALQQAILSAMTNPRLSDAAHPANWAPFVLVQR